MFKSKKCHLCAGSPDIDVPKLKVGEKEFPCDICIAKEIQNINGWGLTTLDCCCGHGDKPIFLCYNNEYNIKWLKENEYNYEKMFNRNVDSGLLKVIMKTDVEFEQRIILETKVWKYLKNNDFEIWNKN